MRVCETLKPYGLKWMEDYIPPDDFVGYETVRQRLPWQTLATGEHWYLPPSLQRQPDGGSLTFSTRCFVVWRDYSGSQNLPYRRRNGISVITHAGMNYPYGQHLAFAMPAITWGERSEGVSAPGVPLEEMVNYPELLSSKTAMLLQRMPRVSVSKLMKHG